GFVAGDGGGQEFHARFTQLLGEREGDRKDHRRRREGGTVVDIVLFGNVGSGRVDHCREQRRAASAVDEDFAGTVGRAHRGGIVGDGFDRARALAAQGGA